MRTLNFYNYMRPTPLQVLDEYDRVCRPSALDETPCSVAEQRAHSGLNRYFNVLPFDFNRVRLQVGDVWPVLLGLH
jgi:protein tyrosine phosphatase